MTNLRLAMAMLLLVSAGLSAQTARTYKTRLAPLPVEATTAASLTGSGTATAVLTGTRLSVSGTFTGLQGPATLAQLHVAPRGMRGPAILDLVVTRATAGTVSGELTLTAVQADHFARSRIYLQIHSEKAPEGNLWGWLLP